MIIECFQCSKEVDRWYLRDLSYVRESILVVAKCHGKRQSLIVGKEIFQNWLAKILVFCPNPPNPLTGPGWTESPRPTDSPLNNYGQTNQPTPEQQS